MGGRQTDETLETKEIDIRSLSSSHGDLPYIHKVGVPPKQTLFDKVKATLKKRFSRAILYDHSRINQEREKLFLECRLYFPFWNGEDIIILRNLGEIL